MDGDGQYDNTHKNNSYVIKAKSQVMIEGYRDLCRSVGMRAGHRQATRYVNEDTGKVYNGFAMVFTGAMWQCSRFCVLTYKRSKQPGDVGFKEWPSESRSFSFSRRKAPIGPCVRFDIDLVTTLPLPNNAGVHVRHNLDRHFLAEDFTILG